MATQEETRYLEPFMISNNGESWTAAVKYKFEFYTSMGDFGTIRTPKYAVPLAEFRVSYDLEDNIKRSII